MGLVCSAAVASSFQFSVFNLLFQQSLCANRYIEKQRNTRKCRKNKLFDGIAYNVLLSMAFIFNWNLFLD